MNSIDPPVLLVPEGAQEKAIRFYSTVFPEWQHPIRVVANEDPNDPPQWQLLRLAEGDSTHWQEGLPTWVEIMTEIGAEEATARAAVSGTPWRLAEGIPFPIENAPKGTMGQYITVLDGSDSLKNKAKLMGVVPALALLPPELVAKLHLPVTFLYFGAASAQGVIEKFQMAKDAGATSVKDPFVGDGEATIMIDPLGALFGIYFPTFDPEEVKPTTKLQSPWKALALGATAGY
jgi:hypothetical protein